MDQQTSTPTTNENVPKVLTPEQEEELKLRSKYPTQAKSGTSSFIQKMLHRGNKKYFDSGDYNMAKSKNKLPPTPLTTTNVNASQLKAPTLPTLPGSTPSTPGSVKSANFNNVDDKSNDDSLLLCQSPMPISSLSSSSSNSNKDTITNDNIIVNGEDIEIGHEIPTPECLPPRKHSNIQSKLANNKQLPSN